MDGYLALERFAEVGAGGVGLGPGDPPFEVWFDYWGVDWSTLTARPLRDGLVRLTITGGRREEPEDAQDESLRLDVVVRAGDLVVQAALASREARAVLEAMALPDEEWGRVIRDELDAADARDATRRGGRAGP